MPNHPVNVQRRLFFMPGMTDASFKAFGGHLLSATVGTGSLEITVIVHDKRLECRMEEPMGANVL
jgi:predicted DNA-binding protein with PD1-like motif